MGAPTHPDDVAVETEEVEELRAVDRVHDESVDHEDGALLVVAPRRLLAPAPAHLHRAAPVAARRAVGVGARRGVVLL